MVENEATSPGLFPDGTVQEYENVPALPGVAITVAGNPWQTEELLTITVGLELKFTVPEELLLEHPVPISVITTLYTPVILVENEDTLPGLAPDGTTHE